MAKISLKVSIAGRTYPLTVNEGEEQRVLKAADDINKAVKLLQENYAVRDMQDLLAMSALQLTTKGNALQNTSSDVNTDLKAIESRLNELNQELDSLG